MGDAPVSLQCRRGHTDGVLQDVLSKVDGSVVLIAKVLDSSVIMA